MKRPKAMKDSKETQASHSLKEGKDYYIEDGKYVFTEAYHFRRGSCCESSCRHCPYGFKDKLKGKKKV
ncbi:MAG: hypothetical protein KDD58_13995 [Bdellovibrionales bacterium]|nr:hypothetical protein [Bdellovibrionales bacterium]